MSISQAVGGVCHVCQLVLLLLDVHYSQAVGGGLHQVRSMRYIKPNTFLTSLLLLYIAHTINTCLVLLLMLTGPMYTKLSTTQKLAHIISCVAIVDCTHVGSATDSFKDLVAVAQENSPTKRQILFVEDQLQLPLDFTIVSQEQELHKPNSRSERGFIC